MPQPTLSDVHVNIPLTNISVAYAQDAVAFIADKVFPPVPVEFKSNLYYIYVRGDWNRDEMQVRAPSTESMGSGYNLANGNYNCDVWGFHKDVDDQIRANSDSVLKPDADATRFITMRNLIRRERQWASKYFVPGVWTTNMAGQATADGTHVQFWNLPSSTPIEDITSASTTIQLASGGFRPNTLVFGRQVWDALKNHPDFVDRIKYGQTAGSGMDRPAIATLQILAQLFEVDRVLMMDAVYNSAGEGVAEANAFIGGKNALLVYSAPSPGLDTPTGGYTFVWSGMFGMVMGTRIRSFRMEHLSSDRFEIDSSYDMKLVGADLGELFASVVQ
jgi:hypothetical protein